MIDGFSMGETACCTFNWVRFAFSAAMYGTVSINGEKLATRTGNVILLKDLFSTAIEKVKEIINEKNPDLPDKDSVAEAVGVGSVIFYYLYNNRIKDINFIMKDALSFEGNTGPYAQYTYARTCGILEKAGEIDFSATEPVLTAVHKTFNTGCSGTACHNHRSKTVN